LTIEVPQVEHEVTSRNGNKHKGEGFIKGVLRLIPTIVCGGIPHHNPELEALF
jgi:hypothetical protein